MKPKDMNFKNSLIYDVWKSYLYIKHGSYLWILLLFLVLSLFMVGCSSSQTTIKEEEIAVKVDDIKVDSITSVLNNVTEEQEAIIDEAYSNLDTNAYYEGNSTVVDESGRKTAINIKFHVGRKDTAGKLAPSFETSIKQDPVKAKVQNKETVKSESTWDKIVIVLVFLAVIAVVVFLIKLFRK